MDILEEGKVIGTAKRKRDGLFWVFACEIREEPQKIRRVFAQKRWKVEYLGIPDKTGKLEARIPTKRLPEGADALLSMQHPKDTWLPWQGDLDGILVERGYIRRQNGDLALALPAEQTVKFPAWTEIWEIEKVFGQEMAVLNLTEEGHLTVRDRETGGYTDEENSGGDPGLDLPAELVADDSSGSRAGNQNERWETDSPDF